MTRIHLALAAVAALGLAPVIAHAANEPEKVTASAPVAPAPESKAQRRADHIEGHIAYLKAELMITPAQEAAWDKVADEMRSAVKDYEDAVTKLPPASDTTTPSAVDSLSERATFATLKAKGENNFLDAFKPLYASFSDSQKQIADDLFVSSPSAENKNK